MAKYIVVLTYSNKWGLVVANKIKVEKTDENHQQF